MHIKLTAADKTDVGKQREQNEDAVYKRIESSEQGDKGVLIVSDGLGGYQAGEVASRLTEETMRRGLGRTVTTALIANDQAYIANVGDSRTYLLRKGQLRPVTRDHSLVARLVEAKQIEPEDVYSHPQRSLIYRSLGAGHKTVEVDVFQEMLQPDDTLLLCSDGLWEMVRQEELRRELSAKSSPQKICDAL